MNAIKQLQRMERLDTLINLRATGNPSELARRLNISESMLYQILRDIKLHFKVAIYYSKSCRSYCYREKMRFICRFYNTDEYIIQKILN